MTKKGRKPTFENGRRVCALFPETEIEQIDAHAEKGDTTRSDIIRDAVRQILPKKTSEEIEHVYKKEENKHDEE